MAGANDSTSTLEPTVCAGEDPEDAAAVSIVTLNEAWRVKVSIGGDEGAYYSPSQARELAFALLRTADAAEAARRLAALVVAYDPKTVTHPGETLQDLLNERGLSQSELAQRMRRPKKTINEIIKGKCSIMPETAAALEEALEIPASFWLRRQADYDAKFSGNGQKGGAR